MKKLFLLLVILFLCKFSFAQKNIEVDTINYSTIGYERGYSNLLKFYLKTSPIQFLLKQNNITLGYNLNNYQSLEFTYSRVEMPSDYFNGIWGNGDACTSQLLSGYRFILGYRIKADVKDNSYYIFNLDFSNKSAKNKWLSFFGPDEEYRWNLKINQTRQNYGINCLKIHEYKLLKYLTFDFYYGLGIKYLHQKTERLTYYHHTYGTFDRHSVIGEHYTNLLFGKSNYILPTLHFGIKLGLSF